ncbi:MAG: acyltransferase family protein [Promethearchaeota archaeon]
MIRLKSIDTFRGIAVIAMLWLHLTEWWLSGDSSTFLQIPLIITQFGFLVSYQFISGVSRYLFYKTGGLNDKSSKLIIKQKIKREFLMRSLFLLVVALLYNSVVAFATSRPYEIWSWFILLSLSISFIMIIPLLDTSKKTRFVLGIVFMVLNFTILSILQLYKGQTNFFGILYYILYYPIGLHPILSSFSVFLIGTVVGDVIYEIYHKEEKKNKLALLKKRLILPSILTGGILITFIAIANSFLFLNLPSLYGIISSLGVSLILFSLWVFIEEFKVIRTKRNYNFIFYFSYYSLTIYLTHNLLYFLFFKLLNALTSFFFVMLAIILIGLLLKFIYPKVGASISIKKIISKLSYKIVMKME